MGSKLNGLKIWEIEVTMHSLAFHLDFGEILGQEKYLFLA